MDILTERLRLVPISQKYAPDMFENFTTEITKYMYPCPAKELSESQEVVASMMKQREAKTDYVYAITDKNTDEFYGLIGLHQLKSEKPELGIWTKKASHGNHFGREAIGGVIDFAKTMGYSTLVYPVDKRNIASKKIPLFYGGKIVIEQKFATTSDGRTLDLEFYDISI